MKKETIRKRWYSNECPLSPLLHSSTLYFRLHLSVTYSLLCIFEWQSWRYSRPSKPSSSLPTSPGLSGQWVSIRAWPSRRLATSMLTLAKQLGQGCGEMDSRVDSPHCALLLPADGVLPWEAIIARCQLTARFYCQCDQPSSSGFL